jgi:hypothetical protein
VEQYEGHCKVCGAMFVLPTSEGRTLEIDRNAKVVANTEVEVGQDRDGFYFEATQDTHW